MTVQHWTLCHWTVYAWVLYLSTNGHYIVYCRGLWHMSFLINSIINTKMESAVDQIGKPLPTCWSNLRDKLDWSCKYSRKLLFPKVTLKDLTMDISTSKNILLCWCFFFVFFFVKYELHRHYLDYNIDPYPGERICLDCRDNWSEEVYLRIASLFYWYGR